MGEETVACVSENTRLAGCTSSSKEVADFQHSPGIQVKFFWMSELKSLWTGDSVRPHYFTGLTGSCACQLDATQLKVLLLSLAECPRYKTSYNKVSDWYRNFLPTHPTAPTIIWHLSFLVYHIIFWFIEVSFLYFIFNGLLQHNTFLTSEINSLS